MTVEGLLFNLALIFRQPKMVLELSFACWDYDRMKAIEDGRVRAEGVDIIFLNYRVEETSVNGNIQHSCGQESQRTDGCC